MELQNALVSVERVLGYTDLPHEPEPDVSTKTQLPADWPMAGALELRKVTMSYREGIPAVLININLVIPAKSKVNHALHFLVVLQVTNVFAGRNRGSHRRWQVFAIDSVVSSVNSHLWPDHH